MDKDGTQGKKPARAVIFKVGERVVCPPHGIGIINSICARTIGGTDQQCFEVTISTKGLKLLVPLVMAEQGGMRRVADKKSIDRVYEILRERNFKIDRQTWNRRHREYVQKLKTGSVFEIAEVLRDLRVLGTDKELSYSEKQMLESAQGLLVSELAVARARTPEKVLTELCEIFA